MIESNKLNVKTKTIKCKRCGKFFVPKQRNTWCPACHATYSVAWWDMKRKINPRNGYVYFIQGAITRLIKIGYTKNPQERLCGLQIGSPDKLTLLLCLRNVTEQSLHVRFAKSREHGEWFAPGKDLLDFIKRECLQVEENKEDIKVDSV